MNPNSDHTIAVGNGVGEELAELLDLLHNLVEMHIDAVRTGAGSRESWRQMT